MSCKSNQPFHSRRTSFGFSLRPPGPQSQSLCFFQKVNIRRNIKLIISRGHQLENFDWNVCPELAGVTHGITLPGNRTFLFTSDQYWRLLPGSFPISNLIFFPCIIHFRSIAVDEYANPGYPRRTRDWWWRCRNSQNMREFRNRDGLAEGLRNRDSRAVLGELRARSDSKTAFLPFHLILLSALVTISSSCKWRSFCELLTSSNPRVLKSSNPIVNLLQILLPLPTSLSNSSLWRMTNPLLCALW